MKATTIRERDSRSGRSNRSGRLLLASGLALVVAAGLLLWWRFGAAIFNDTVSAALAWCF
jgi:hypothetical protein